MLELQTATRWPSPSGWPVPATDDHVRGFLVESERRVVLRCKKLLRAPNLPSEEQPRLMQLLEDAEARLRDLAP
jgi:hypothetical protein